MLFAQEIMNKAKAKGVKLHFPVDYVTGNQLKPGAKTGLANDQSGIPADVRAM
jgi:phosphoglycerate kinase